ncbi:MAG: ABC transporter substrate-binding protein [Nitrososphaerales archaeon]|jgi:ABC-type transport system substrate-binding protein
MDSKYTVLALAFLLTFSAIPIVYSSPPKGTVLSPSQVDTHGPRISTVVFSVISSDAALESALAGGTIQAAEWTFSVSSFNSMAGNPNVYENTTAGYWFGGIAFNALQPYMNNAHFRRAIAYLTDYSYIQTTVLSGVLGTATPYVMPCTEYGFMCGNEPAAYGYSTTQAAIELAAAGLHPSNGGVAIAPGSANSSTTWCTSGALPCPSGDTFAPVLTYSPGTPFRAALAEGLAASAEEIGFVITAKPAGIHPGEIWSLTGCHPGTYVPSTGYNTAPVFNGSYLAYYNNSASSWSMYAYAWVSSNSYELQAMVWNSAYACTSINFGNFYNTTMDYDSNAVLYATTVSGAETGAINLAKVEMQQLPYVSGYFTNTLYADYIAGWTGYANEPTTGPNAGGGLYYTLLNIHQTDALTGGTLNLAIHQKADQGGMNPLYNTNWIWQEDLWGEVYGTPLATPPTQFTTVNSFLNYMTTSYLVTPYTGKIPSGSFYYQTPGWSCGTNCKIPKTITNGEVITLNFARNITWSDGVRFTAKDYQYSLYVWDIAGSLKIPDIVTPYSWVLTGPSGLIASHVTVGSKVDSISIYINSLSVWNPADVIVPVMPQHVLQYFNPDRITTVINTLDTTLPYVSDVGYFTQSGNGTKVPTAPKWMKYEPSMEIGTGPFTLASYSESTGGGELTANVNYFRTAWFADINATTNNLLAGNTYAHNFTISEYIYNPTSTTYCGVSAGTNGYCPITGKVSGESSVKVSKVVELEYCTGVSVPTGGTTCSMIVNSLTGKPVTYNLVHHIVYTCTNGGTVTTTTGTKTSHSCPTGDKLVKTYTNGYTLAVDTTGFARGYYEVILSTSFSFQGLSRTWYQATGFEVS